MANTLMIMMMMSNISDPFAVKCSCEIKMLIPPLTFAPWRQAKRLDYTETVYIFPIEILPRWIGCSYLVTLKGHGTEGIKQVSVLSTLVIVIY